MPAMALTLLISVCIPTYAQSSSYESSATGLCGPLENAFGPFDYRTAAPANRKLVEGAHFTPSVESLQRGSTGQLGGDIDYTLRAFPNHPRALYAMTRLAERSRSTKPPGAHFPVECYYDRAIRFRPDDAIVRGLYASFLIRQGRPDEARVQLKAAEDLGPSDPQVIYNLGLAYFDLKEFDRSLALAKRAYAMGIPFPGLRDKLKRAGRWRD
jgi:Tfp pilus assembly protein PilF